MIAGLIRRPSPRPPRSLSATRRARCPTARGPGFASLDFSLAKNIAFTESLRLQFRSEFFNLTNRMNLSQPDTNFLSGNFGRITSAGEPRRVQFGLKLYF